MHEIFSTIISKYRKFQFTPKKQQALLEDLANLLEDGVSVNVALDLMLSFSQSPIDAEVIRQMQLKMSEGDSFVLGLTDWCQSNVIEIIHAGEEGGTLTESIRMAATTVQGQNEAVDAFVGGLIYPGTMLIAGLGMMVYISATIFPSFLQIKPLESWPSTGQSAFAFAQFVKYFWWAVAGGLVGVILFVNYMLKHYIGDFRPKLDKIPPFSIYRQIIGARFMATLGLLIRNGILLKQALRISQKNAPPYLYSHILMMQYRLSGGRDNIADVLDTGLIESHDLARLRVVAMGKGFDDALTRQGKHSMGLAVHSIKLAGKIIGGICMAATASLLGFMFFAIYNVGMSLATL